MGKIWNLFKASILSIPGNVGNIRQFFFTNMSLGKAFHSHTRSEGYGTFLLCFILCVFGEEEVAREFGVLVQFQRFWIWAKRQNHTYRPNRPLTTLEESQSVGQLKEVSTDYIASYSTT